MTRTVEKTAPSASGHGLRMTLRLGAQTTPDADARRSKPSAGAKSAQVAHQACAEPNAKTVDMPHHLVEASRQSAAVNRGDP